MVSRLDESQWEGLNTIAVRHLIHEAALSFSGEATASSSLAFIAAHARFLLKLASDHDPTPNPNGGNVNTLVQASSPSPNPDDPRSQMSPRLRTCYEGKDLGGHSIPDHLSTQNDSHYSDFEF